MAIRRCLAMPSPRRRFAVVLLLLGLTVVVRPVAADDALDARQLVEKARFTLENFVADHNMAALRDLLPRAKGVLVTPDLLRAGFILGGSGGSAVYLARTPDGGWAGPAFYTMGSASFGLQAGVDSSEIVLVAMTERGAKAMLDNSVKLGAGASVAAGPVGAGVAGATANLSADLIAYSRAKGLYGGIAVDGAVVATRDGWNQAFYGRPASATDILVRRSVTSPQAAPLIQALEKAARR
jgi:lipid-binding SYLF domain-containing protein